MSGKVSAKESDDEIKSEVNKNILNRKSYKGRRIILNMKILKFSFKIYIWILFQKIKANKFYKNFFT